MMQYHKIATTNNAGGQAFQLDKWKQLERFIVLGTEGGTFYVSERDLTRTNIKSVMACICEDPARTIDRVVEISEAGRAYKNDPAIFVLALVFADDRVSARQYASMNFNRVIRTSTHLFRFNEYVESLRGRGQLLNKTVRGWYLGKDVDELAYQAVKYKNRDGWSHRDLLRLTKPKTSEEGRNNIFGYITKGYNKDALMPRIIHASELIKDMDNSTAAKMIHTYKLPREVVPTQMLDDAEVWAALLVDMPITATIRNLGKMTAVGTLKPFSPNIGLVVDRITNDAQLKKGRVHPIQLLAALKTYQSGRGHKGKLTWEPVPQISEALNRAFYKSFNFVPPTGKRILMAVDVSGSMSSPIPLIESISCCEGATAMAMAIASVETNYHIMAFDQGLKKLPIHNGMYLSEALRHTRDVNFGGTDCSLPMLYALENNLEVDAFVVITDSETWAGSRTAAQRLQTYREMTGINSKLIVIAMTSNEFTIADPKDPGMLDVVGFDTNTPAVITNFIGE